MRRLLFTVLLFAFILLVLLQLHELLVPYYWGNTRYAQTMSYLRSHDHRFNTYFFGSSRVGMHIIPSIFDSLTVADTYSFNLGAPGAVPPEAYAFYESFLEQDAPNNTRYAFMGLSTIDAIADENLHTKRSKYHLDYHYFRFAVDYFAGRRIGPEMTRELIRKYAMSYGEKLLKVGLVSAMYRFVLDPPSVPTDIGERQGGFYRLRKKGERFWGDPAVVDAMLERARSFYQHTKLPPGSEAQIAEIRRLIERSEARGIHLVFLFMPGAGYALFPVFEAIDAQHRLDLVDPSRFPDLYRIENYHDGAHFNHQGARLFTQRLAEEFNELVELIGGERSGG